MGKNKKKKNYQRILKNKKNTSIQKNNEKNISKKKILDGVDLGNLELEKNIIKNASFTKEKKEIDIEKNLIEENDNQLMDIVFNNKKEEIINSEKEIENKFKLNLNDRIQSITSILFTIIIFIALILLIFVLYNNYLKKEKEIVCKKEEVCIDFIKKDYKIKEESVKNYLFKIRGVIYNIDNFNIKQITNDDYINFATYFTWNHEGDYLICDNTIDNNCLTTKKEISKNELNNYLKKYLNLNDIDILFPTEFTSDDKIRIYENDDKIILTFSEFEYETLKHDIVDIRIDEDKIYIIFALSKKIEDDDIYSYIGYKKLELKYQDKNFIIQNVKTNLS